MKKLEIKILEDYKSYKKEQIYSLEGDLIVLSGVNGSGKSQLLKIIANNTNEKIARELNFFENDNHLGNLENILLLSFRDNINMERTFGDYNINIRQLAIMQAWNFYEQNIKFKPNNNYYNNKVIENFKNDKLLYTNEGIKNHAWRSIQFLVSKIKDKYSGDDVHKLTKEDIEFLLPNDFIWRNDNDIIQQVGNLFYVACCKRANLQIQYSKTTDIFDNETWLKSAPWTILNKLFKKLNFKYRFKHDYEFQTPNLDENPKLRISEQVRELSDLSDGEKAILKLALISLDEEISKDIKIALFDEYDATLNPSLIESFYQVIEDFYIKKGIQVILSTHSPVTISLSPVYTQFYEMFSQNEESPKIIRVNQFDYAELKEVNEKFYSKIKNQNDRIKYLESVVSQSGNALLVEDEYCQIYKIAYLKLKNINDLTEENIDKLFNKNANFSINGNYSVGGLYNYLNCLNTSLDKDCKRICLFDFDFEGYSKFKAVSKLKRNGSNETYYEKYGEIKDGLYLKHKLCERYALMLPIPDRLINFVSKKSSNDCFIAIESLLSESFAKQNLNMEIRSNALNFYKVKDEKKNVLWKDLIYCDKSCFEDFKPLFDFIEGIFN